MGDEYQFDMDNPQESLDDLTDMEDHGIWSVLNIILFCCDGVMSVSHHLRAASKCAQLCPSHKVALPK